jgi:superoxide reductase
MTQKNQVYKCSHCGNVVEVVHAAGGTLSCCGDSMQELKENTVDASKEKHIPVVSKIDGGYKVVVGSIEHPMEETHLIEFIELVTPSGVLRKSLKAGDKPEAVFITEEKDVYAREFCNLHGLWKA